MVARGSVWNFEKERITKGEKKNKGMEQRKDEEKEAQKKTKRRKTKN